MISEELWLDAVYWLAMVGVAISLAVMVTDLVYHGFGGKKK